MGLFDSAKLTTNCTSTDGNHQTKHLARPISPQGSTVMLEEKERERNKAKKRNRKYCVGGGLGCECSISLEVFRRSRG